MRITILCVGKIKESFYREAIGEYVKRLGKYCRLEIVEVADEKTPDRASAAMEEQIRGGKPSGCCPAWKTGLLSALWRSGGVVTLRKDLRRSSGGRSWMAGVISSL